MTRRAFLVLVGALCLAPAVRAEAGVLVEVIEKVPAKRSWDFTPPAPADSFRAPGMGIVGVPAKWSDKGIVIDHSNPFLVRASASLSLPAGDYRLLLRARNAARLFVDGKAVVQTKFLNPNASGHEHVPEHKGTDAKGLYPLAVGHQEKIITLTLPRGEHAFRLEAIVGGKNLRAEVGELVVGIAGKGEPFRLLGPGQAVALDDDGWDHYVKRFRADLEARDDAARRKARAGEAEYWDRRHAIARRIWEKKDAPAIPTVAKTTPVHNAIDRFLGARIEKASVTPAPLTDDATFLRRVTLDTVGVVPTPEEIRAFEEDRRPDRRARVIERLLADRRWADHWVGYWQDVLAENPGILKPMLNNTGPFRYWIHQAFRDNLPMDRFVTDLVLMEGSPFAGAPAGFAMATQNDVPMAAKAHVLGQAFLGVELKCARCHDAPYHPFGQRVTFELAAMLARKPQKVPTTSSVPPREGGRKPRVEVTLEPGTRVAPAWPFAEEFPGQLPEGVLRNPKDTRERLAALITSPHNERFAEVIVNRLWQRYLGRGLVEPVDDWTGTKPSHPELLRYLARELVQSGYDLKHVARLILESHAYQRQVRPEEKEAPADLFASPVRRRLTAEQMVDSLFLVAGKKFDSEELTMDPEGRRPAKTMLNLGRPKRAWGFTSLSNERDRPALALPTAQSIIDLLAAYGWRQSRPDPITVRDQTPTPLQPLLLANGIVGRRITRLSDDSAFTELCLKEQPLAELIDAVFLRVLSRAPSAEEKAVFEELLHDGYADRVVPGAKPLKRRRQATAVSWSNHLSPEATRIKLEMERRAREGDPPSPRLRGPWRERMEDMLWALINSPEFAFVP